MQNNPDGGENLFGNGNHVIDADRLKLNVYFDIHKRADDLARVQIAITTQTELVQAVYETGKPVPKEYRETFRKENNFMKIAFWKSGKIRSFEVDKDAVQPTHPRNPTRESAVARLSRKPRILSTNKCKTQNIRENEPSLSK